VLRVIQAALVRPARLVRTACKEVLVTQDLPDHRDLMVSRETQGPADQQDLPDHPAHSERLVCLERKVPKALKVLREALAQPGLQVSQDPLVL